MEWEQEMTHKYDTGPRKKTKKEEVQIEKWERDQIRRGGDKVPPTES